MTTDSRLKKCPVCETEFSEGEAIQDFHASIYQFNCRKCGRFETTWDATNNVLRFLGRDDRPRLSGVLRERFEMRRSNMEAVRLSSDNISAYLANAPSQFDVATKVRKLLSAVARRTRQPGEWVDLPDDTSSPLAYAAHVGEWIYLSEYANDQHWVSKKRDGGTMQLLLTPDGWEEVQRRPRIESANVFVAMRFHRSTDEAYELGIKPAIEQDSLYRAIRLDAVHFNGDIIDKLMSEIRVARFVVADLTGHRRGVYFEAGFAKGLDIDVIWTCYAPRAGRTHFDAEHFNQIRWDTPADLRDKLKIRIGATFGLGPLRP